MSTFYVFVAVVVRGPLDIALVCTLRTALPVFVRISGLLEAWWNLNTRQHKYTSCCNRIDGHCCNLPRVSKTLRTVEYDDFASPTADVRFGHSGRVHGRHRGDDSTDDGAV